MDPWEKAYIYYYLFSLSAAKYLSLLQKTHWVLSEGSFNNFWIIRVSLKNKSALRIIKYSVITSSDVLSWHTFQHRKPGIRHSQHKHRYAWTDPIKKDGAASIWEITIEIAGTGDRDNKQNVLPLRSFHLSGWINKDHNNAKSHLLAIRKAFGPMAHMPFN